MLCRENFIINKLSYKLKKAIILAVIHFFARFTIFGLQADLVWPLKIPIIQSSSFAEYRGLRFHAGIDIKTFQKTGYPVFSIADGYVSRIKIQHRGGGYSIYIDHPQLKIRSLYAHLESYAEPMQSFIKDIQNKTKRRYDHDIYLKPSHFVVKKGQLIGYSGESGVGPPHLHFELRNLNDEPFSPSLLGYIASDSNPPQFIKLFIEPFSWNSIINNNFKPLSIDVVKISSSSFTIPNTITAAGKFTLSVGITDFGDKGSKFGIEMLELYINNKLVFKRSFHIYNYDHNIFAPYIYDFYKSEFENAGFVYTLYKNPNDNSYFSKDLKPWDGVFEFDNGLYKLEIVAQDFSGNKSLLSFNILSNYQVPQLFDINIISKKINELHQKLKLSTSNIYYLINSFVVEYKIENLNSGINSVLNKINEVNLPIRMADKYLYVSFPISNVFDNEEIYKLIYIYPHKYCNEEGNTLKLENENEKIIIRFPPNSIPNPIIAAIKEEKVNLLTLASYTQLQPITKCYKFYPSNIVTIKPFKVMFYLCSQEIQNNPKQLGVFSISNSYVLSYIGGTTNNNDNSIILETRNLSQPIIVMRDKIPPTIKYLGKRFIKNLGKCLVFHVTDVGKGIDWYNNKALIGNKTYDIDSDPDKNELYVIINNFSKVKNKSLELTVYDLAGNKTKYQNEIK